MFKDIKLAIKISFVYVALIIGAGFASGKELIYYFLRYSNIGFLGIILSSFMFGIIGWIVLDICNEKSIKSYNDFVDKVLGKNMGSILEIAVVFFMFILFSTMLSAGGNAINQAFNLPYTFAVFIISFFCFIIFLYDIEALLSINIIITPIMIIGGVFISLYVFFSEVDIVFSNYNNIILFIKDNWVSSSIIYVSYNIITAISVLASMNEYILSSKIAKLSGLFTGILMCILGIFISLPIFLFYSEAIDYEIPMLTIVHKYNLKIEYFYLIILISAIFTTAISNGFSVINWLYFKINLNKIFLKILVIFFAILFSYVGFSNFVSKIYPIFTLIGIIEVFMIIKFYMKINKK